MAAFAHECTRQAGERVLNQRGGALVNRLLVEADRKGMPLTLLSGPVNDAARSDWQGRFDRALVDALGAAERVFTQPTGGRRFLQETLVVLANTLPEGTLVVSLLLLLWRYFVPEDGKAAPGLFDALLPFVLTLVVLVLLQGLIALLLPTRWAAVRDEFRRQLRDKLDAEYTAVYGPLPGETAAALARAGAGGQDAGGGGRGAGVAGGAADGRDRRRAVRERVTVPAPSDRMPYPGDHAGPTRPDGFRERGGVSPPVE